MSGRSLALVREDALCEGKTTELFISRLNIYMDAMAELITDPPFQDVSCPLEVTSSSDEAVDYGGPQKEFLGAVIREIQEGAFH